MKNRKSRIQNRKSRAFTLLELLIVMGIILVLVGILVPVASQVRKAVYSTNTKQMIQRLESGINAYYSDFGAYPGPFANGQLKPFTAVAPVLTVALTYTPNLPTPPAIPAASAPTSSENMFVGLSGGLRITGSPVITQFVYDSNVGTINSGPGNLNPGNIKRYSGYVAIQSNETSFGIKNPIQPTNASGVWNVAAGTLVGDTPIPEVLDKYPDPLPMLYMRANRGTSSFYSDRTTYNAHDQQTQYQHAAIRATYTGRLRPQNLPWSFDTASFPVDSTRDNVNVTIATVTQQTGNAGSVSPGAFQYFGNPASSTTGTAQHANKDGFILISAGPDGIYGTRDDITNFRAQ